jgi:hypothetical protein
VIVAASEGVTIYVAGLAPTVEAKAWSHKRAFASWAGMKSVCGMSWYSLSVEKVRSQKSDSTTGFAKVIADF